MVVQVPVLKRVWESNSDTVCEFQRLEGSKDSKVLLLYPDEVQLEFECDSWHHDLNQRWHLGGTLPILPHSSDLPQIGQIQTD